MNEQELSAMVDEADRLAVEVNAKLDDPSYVFDGDGQAYISQLQALASRCNAANLRFAGRRLEQLVGDIQERTGKSPQNCVAKLGSIGATPSGSG